MHEIGIAKTIIDIINEEVQSRGITGPVQSIRFRVGRLHTVIPDILTFNFDVLKKDFEPLRQTNLTIEEIPIRVRCKTCSALSELEEPLFLCMKCGGSVSVESGQEMYVEGFSFDSAETQTSNTRK